MKRIFKTGMLAIALISATAGAYATKTAHTASIVEPRYDWSGSGPDHSGFLPAATIAEAQEAYGCFGQNDPCAGGEKVSGDGAPTANIFLTDN